MFPLLRINDLSIDFVSESGTTSALKNVSLSLDRSEIFAIVGESGSGKSVTALSILRLLSKTAKFNSGEIIFSEDGKNEITGNIHKNVFALGSVCNFPSTINEGDEFYFAVDSTYVSNCAVCLAYYPKPAKSIAIKVVNK